GGEGGSGERLRGLDAVYSRRYRPGLSAAPAVQTRLRWVDWHPTEPGGKDRPNRKAGSDFQCLGCVGQTETVTLDEQTYGCPQTKTIEKPPTHAAGLQQRAQAPAAQLLPPVRGPLPPPPSLPGLRVLQGTPDHHGHSRGISSESAVGWDPRCALSIY